MSRPHPESSVDSLAPRLADFTTLRLGGPPRALRRATSTSDLIAAVTDCDAAGEPVLLIAGGSNLVIGDDGFAGTAIRIETTGLDFGIDHRDGAPAPFVTAEAGADWDGLVATTVQRGYGGLECLSGIPGAAGTTPVQNVGAYGVEVAEVLRSVQLLDRHTGEISWVAPQQLGLAYRTSRLKGRSDEVVLAVSFWLNDDAVSAPIRYRELAGALGVGEGERADAARVRAQVLSLRAGKGMVLDDADHDTWSAGSFFTNPIIAEADLPAVLARIASRLGAEVKVPHFPSEAGIKLSAGWLIERAGFTRGFPGDDAPVRLSTKHTLALTNRGAATTADLIALATTVRDGVAAAFGVVLHPEPVFVGCTLG
ncbi:UDP-N-acetylenolpyruvoylglucosamine reductase [Gordonia hirsuta DSM 44140 = NBRC 16056]|uniref:UDP-N-acetylenolpyruvoylglucosamine reductase n=1 Tax=Gordonia hirsuta DSM 44140 = NBRC 16056 TaxID=1121927 RepID=L7L712_9ACTN|nr:UDP-N-acetylmuramate dehydrogenase [Gordonia hirsuta]GAC56935.1 UDP-N-acetylenolpyruvoylglucosamine reductase [Gordonia hirsuta DSM 44140 = NBRC 16056]